MSLGTSTVSKLLQTSLVLVLRRVRQRLSHWSRHGVGSSYRLGPAGPENLQCMHCVGRLLAESRDVEQSRWDGWIATLACGGKTMGNPS